MTKGSARRPRRPSAGAAVAAELAAIRRRLIARYGLDGVPDVRVIVRATLWERESGGELRPVLTGCRDALLRRVRSAPSGRTFAVALVGELPMEEVPPA